MPPLTFLVRTENNICFGEVYRNVMTSRTKDLTPRSLHQLTTPLPHLPYKRALLKAFWEFGVFKV